MDNDATRRCLLDGEVKLVFNSFHCPCLTCTSRGLRRGRGAFSTCTGRVVCPSLLCSPSCSVLRVHAGLFLVRVPVGRVLSGWTGHGTAAAAGHVRVELGSCSSCSVSLSAPGHLFQLRVLEETWPGLGWTRWLLQPVCCLCHEESCHLHA